MKKIEATIKPINVEQVKQPLTEGDVAGMTASEVKGFGREKGHTEIYRGSEYTADFLPKIRFDIVLPDADVDAAIAAIIGAAKTGKIGDGKIFVLPIEEAVCVRTAGTAEQAA